MRKLLWAVLIATLATTVSLGQAAKTAPAGNVEKQISALMDQGREAALKGDTSWTEKNAADDYSAITSIGEYLSKAEVISRTKAGKVKYQAIDVLDRKIHVYRTSAVVQGKSHLKATRDGQDISGDYWGTWCWVNQSGTWKLAASHSTRIAAPGK